MLSVTLSGVSFSYDGPPLFSHVTASLTGRTGITGANGTGKTTLLRLLAGEVRPSAGTVRLPAEPQYLPQNPGLPAGRSLADIMGLTEKLTALRAVQAGSVRDADFAVIRDDWDLEERALTTLHTLGFAENLTDAGGILDRRAAALSGGETMAAALAGLMLRRPALLLLDEPTVSLDAPAREWLYRTAETWQGCLIAVSHDAALLERMDAVAELRDGALRLYGGPFSFYQAARRAERETAERRVREAEAVLKGEKRRREGEQQRTARSAKQGAVSAVKSRFPSAALHLRRARAEQTAGRRRTRREERIADAEKGFREAKTAAEPDERIRADFPETELPAGKTALEIEASGRTLSVQGPERIALTGRNGSGKTTLFRVLLGETSLPDIHVRRIIPETGILPQRSDHLDGTASLLDNLRRHAPDLTANAAYAALARFLFRGGTVRRKAAELSGGERLRLALACLLCASPPPRLLLLDEPANSLDRQSTEQLVQAVRQYRGAVIVVSHDEDLLRSIGVRRRWTMRSFQLSEQAAAGFPD